MLIVGEKNTIKRVIIRNGKNTINLLDIAHNTSVHSFQIILMREPGDRF